MSSIKKVAIIMDGNGRWAKARLRPRIWGHIRGAEVVRSIVTAAAETELESLVLYAFSTENWTRPTEEVTNIFKLLKKFLIKEKSTLIKNNVQFDVIGNYKVLDSTIVELIETIKSETNSNTGLKLSLAINYGGRAEIVDAVNRCLKENKTREISERDISDYLYNPELKDIDLLIRTSGDQRISNFLLWQLSYSEMHFTDTKWPDFTKEEFIKILETTGDRERRFGGLSFENESKPSKLKVIN